jgi:hypothetical protein
MNSVENECCFLPVKQMNPGNLSLVTCIVQRNKAYFTEI